MSDTIEPNDPNEGWLLKSIDLVALSADEAMAFAQQRLRMTRAAYPKLSEDDVQDFAAESVVNRYCRWAAGVGVSTGAVGAVPGLGTAIAVVGGASADAVASMKLQVDMAMILAAIYGYDLREPDARQLAFLLAATGTLGHAGGHAVGELGKIAGVRMIRMYLKGAVLQTLKAFFRKIGIVFTRKALEKALPFGIGMLVGGTANYWLTKYVGNELRKWFVVDRSDGGPAVTLGKA